ncbi:hypothetical protein M0R45_030224 [Rubus argutus]|uniref:DC1 domain-containing protein n=1 Tax=Rubus argutus TaxID=59490 RepID=A0AAW1WA25_RUBAR
MDQLHHLRHHEHPLMFKEEAHKEIEDGAAVPAGGTFLCAACGELVLGSSYTCNQCSQFVLHKTCAELPRVISHLIHRKHPLILLPNRYYYCDVCCGNRRRLQSYKCRQCDFNLDIQCASNLSNIKYAEHFSHEHILIFREEKEKENAGSLVFVMVAESQWSVQAIVAEGLTALTLSINHVWSCPLRSSTGCTPNTHLFSAKRQHEYAAVIPVTKTAAADSLTVASNVTSTLTSNVLPIKTP